MHVFYLSLLKSNSCMYCKNSNFALNKKKYSIIFFHLKDNRTIHKLLKLFSQEGDIERETCCCPTNNCFTPPWLGQSKMSTVQISNEPNQIQRVLLVVIGVALGVLIMGKLKQYILAQFFSLCLF